MVRFPSPWQSVSRSSDHWAPSFTKFTHPSLIFSSTFPPASPNGPPPGLDIAALQRPPDFRRRLSAKDIDDDCGLDPRLRCSRTGRLDIALPPFLASGSAPPPLAVLEPLPVPRNVSINLTKSPLDDDRPCLFQSRCCKRNEANGRQRRQPYQLDPSLLESRLYLAVLMPT